MDVKPGANVDKDGNAKVELTEKEIAKRDDQECSGKARAEIIAISRDGQWRPPAWRSHSPRAPWMLFGSRQGASVSIQSDLGRVLLSRDVLTSISETTEGGAVTVTVAAGKAENAVGC